MQGFHLGEKDHIEKFALWEKAPHVPLVIADSCCPESAGKTCGAPAVSSAGWGCFYAPMQTHYQRNFGIPVYGMTGRFILVMHLYQ